MVFASNPLALSVPEPAFDSWLRESGYLEILDQRTTELSRVSAAGAPSSAVTDSTTASSSASITPEAILRSLFSCVWTILSLFTFNPFSKLSSGDFAGDIPAWTLAFFGYSDSYSFPSSPAQARMRVHENVKRFARNYGALFILFFACSLYQLPRALFGLILCLALWESLKFGGDRWKLDRYPALRQSLIHSAQCAAAIILFVCNVQLAVLCAVGVSYAVMILHASFRKLTPAKQPAPEGGYKRIGRK